MTERQIDRGTKGKRNREALGQSNIDTEKSKETETEILKEAERD